MQTNLADISGRVAALVLRLVECLNASGMSETERLVALSALLSMLAGRVVVEHPEGPLAEIHALKEAAARFGMAAMSELTEGGEA